MAWNTIDKQVESYTSTAVGRVVPVFFPSVTTSSTRLTDLNSAGVGMHGQAPTPTAAGSGGQLHAAGNQGYAPITDAGVGKELRVNGINLAMSAAGAVHVYERIWSCSGFNATLNTAQTITGFPTLTIPDANGTGLEMFVEIFTQIGATGTTVTASYTNSSNTAGRTTIAQSIGNTGLREVFRLIRLPLQVGDTGVKSIQSVTLAATTGTAGNFGLVLAKKLTTYTNGAAFASDPQDFAGVGLPKVDNTAALMYVYVAAGSTSGVIDGTLLIGEA